MGLRGPAPVPTSLLDARGSWRAKINPGEPKPERGKPTCPKSLNKAAREIWRRLTTMLDDLGLLTKIDGFQIERYCTYFVRWRECEAFIAKNGITYTLKADEATRYIGRLPNNGDFIAGFAEYPHVKESHRLDTALKQIEASFGLTPSARARLKAEPVQQEADPMAVLLSSSEN